jgi:hypothetical protein
MGVGAFSGYPVAMQLTIIDIGAISAYIFCPQPYGPLPQRPGCAKQGFLLPDDKVPLTGRSNADKNLVRLIRQPAYGRNTT